MKVILLFLILLGISEGKYLDSATCKECHEDIYAEHTKSMHHKSSIFSDEVHKKVKEIEGKDGYSCALCHMPAAKNLSAVIRGTEKLDSNDKSHTDGVSCFYCHQISKIHYSKAYNINFSSAVNGDKPTMFGNLKNPDFGDKHDSKENEIYKNSEVCMGCHSHKQNSHGFEVCNTKDQHDSRSDCIGCHMPKAPGGNEKFNKRGREEYATHNFLGIRSDEMVKRSVKLELSHKQNKIELTIINKMGHSIITHPMRLKFVKTVVKRDSKIIWSNFKDSPIEDKEATFIVAFKDEDGKQSMPNKAKGYALYQNLKALEAKTITYTVDNLQKGDEIEATWISYVINPKIAEKLDIKTEEFIRPYIGVKESIVVR
ncbi:MAG: multiheme c-type cytochrome [Sulfurimonas sp.]|uniref:multiheme c-type cytochrome n=1 Tax=Sulfurimonas sp. TaxID=2022749 RepID=UPI000CCF40BC|nr:MAG: hypothetical protein C0627_05510 [Sulfurimonas sp.]